VLLSANESLVLESMLLTGEIWLLKVLKVVVDGGVYWFVNDAVWVVGPRESKWWQLAGGG